MTLKICNYMNSEDRRGLVLILQATLKTACLEKRSAWGTKTNSWSTTEEAGIMMYNTRFVRKVMQFVFFRHSSWSQCVRTGWVRWGGTFTFTTLLNSVCSELWERQDRCFREPPVSASVMARNGENYRTTLRDQFLC